MSSSRKREKPYFSRHLPYSFPKRRRPLSSSDTEDRQSPSQPAAVLVIGLPSDCSVLDLKSRFQIYGPISRIRIDPHGVGFLTFRSKSAADSAVAAALDPSFGITFDSKPVQVILASDAKGRGEQQYGGIEQPRYSSKLLRPETPLSRHGRANRLSSAVVSSSNNGGTSNTGDKPSCSSSSDTSALDVAFKGRELVAYDDLL